jgi:DNA-binding transcriptional ArsR family regulator
VLKGRTELKLAADDWARLGFVRSLLFEAEQAVRVLLYPARHVHQRAWLDTIDRDAARAQLPLLEVLNPSRAWIPDFLAPPARASERTFEDELDEVAGYPATMIAEQLRRALDSYPTRRRQAVLEPLIADPERALSLIVEELRWTWTRLVEPFWAPVRELISADIAYRTRQIGRSGLGLAVNDLHPTLGWDEGLIVIQDTYNDDAVELAGRGLALMPSAFVWPGVLLVHEPPWQPTIVYPARGIGDLWSAPPAPPSGLAGVLGGTRALLLADLGQPATTTSLAVRHRLSPAAVSAQLGHLRAAGLISAHRLGKEVLYQRTALGDGLVRASWAGVGARPAQA